MSNKEKARIYYQAVSNYDSHTIESMIEESYIQHNPHMPTGRAAFLSLIPILKKYGSKIENIRMIGDGPYIAMHHIWKNALPFGGQEMVAFHIIRFSNQGQIAEHWSVMKVLQDSFSGRSVIEGEAEITDHDDTENNKLVISGLFDLYINDLFGAEPLDLQKYFHNDFLDHASLIDNGANDLLGNLRSAQVKIKVKKLHKIIGEGNFVLSVSEGICNNLPTAFYDLYRLKQGKLTEHWSIYQEIPTVNLANENTMFNFG